MTRLEPDLPNIPVLSCPVTFIVPVFSSTPFSTDIPMDLFPEIFTIPVFFPKLSVASPEALLFFINIPAACSPSSVRVPAFVTFIFPCPRACVPNSFSIGNPELFSL